MTDRKVTVNEADLRCNGKLPWVGSRVHDCAKPLGHSGVHRCACSEEWLNEDDHTPCPSRATAVLGIVHGQAEVRCGLQADHSGAHRFAMEWEGGIPIDGRTFPLSGHGSLSIKEHP